MNNFNIPVLQNNLPQLIFVADDNLREGGLAERCRGRLEGGGHCGCAVLGQGAGKELELTWTTYAILTLHREVQPLQAY